MLNQNPVIDAAMRAATAAVAKTATSPTNDMSATAVADAKPELQANISAAIAADPVVKNATNTEDHWWQKRSRWAMIISLALVVLNPVLQRYGVAGVSPQTQDYIVTACTTLGNLAAAGMALWAGNAITPLFTRTQPANPVAYRG
jgi:hypothetical protein